MTLLSAESFSALNVAQYSIRLRALEPARLPAFAGSALRGAFGHALKSAVCVMPHRDCQRCLVASRCIYPATFEPQFPAHLTEWKSETNAPAPYVLDPPVYQQRAGIVAKELESNLSADGGMTNVPPRRQPKWESHRPLEPGEEIVVGLTLMGQAIEHLPFIVLAIHEMTQRGIGAAQPVESADSSADETSVSTGKAAAARRFKRPQFALAEVAEYTAERRFRTLYTESDQRLASTTAVLPLSQWVAARVAEWDAADRVRVRFLTPTRIKVDGDLQPRVDFPLLARNLLRRVSMLTAIYGGAKPNWEYAQILAAAAEIRTVESALRWWDVQRYSARQQTPLKMGGFVGHVEFASPQLREFWPLLAAGELLRVGKNVSFGLGKFRVETLTNSDDR